MTYMRVYMYISESSSQAQFLLNWDRVNTNLHIVETAYLFNRIRVEGALIPPESFSVADAGEGGSGAETKLRPERSKKKIWDHLHPLYLKVVSSTGVSKGCARKQLHSVSCGWKAGRSPFFKIYNFAGPGYTSQVFSYQQNSTLPPNQGWENGALWLSRAASVMHEGVWFSILLAF